MGWPETICLALAAAILAANQALKDAPAITARVPGLRPRGWWNYLPLGLVALALLLFFIGRIGSSITIGERDQPVVLGVPIEQIAAGAGRSPSPDAVRQAMWRFIGARAEVRGRIVDLGGDPARRIATLREPGPLSGRRPGIQLWLQEGQGFLVERLQAGDRIVARCVFRGRASRALITFEECLVVRAEVVPNG